MLMLQVALEILGNALLRASFFFQHGFAVNNLGQFRFKNWK